MLSVKYGPFQPSLEDAFVTDLLALKKKDPLAPVAVVAPSRRLADRLQRLLAAERGAALLNVSFHTFHSLAERIVQESGGLAKPVWGDPLFYDQLMNGLLDSASGKRLLSGRPKQRGLAAAIRASLRDLSDAGVEPGRVKELLAEGLLPDPEDAARLGALLDLLAAYDRKVAALPVAPPSELTRAATEAVPASAWLKSFASVAYYGFYDLTGLQADFFEAVVRARDVSVYYPYRKDVPAYAFAKTFFESKMHLLGAAPVELANPESRPPNPERISVSGNQDELWKTAKEILRLVEEKGYAFSDIGVVARSLEPYRLALRDAFAEQGVPISTSAAEPLLRFPVAKLCLSLLTLKERDFPALAVQDLLGSPYFRTEAAPRERSDWRTLIRRLKIHRGLLQWEGKLDRWTREPFPLNEEASIPAAHAAGLLSLVAGWARELGAEAKSRKGWKAKAAHARKLIAAVLALPEKPEPRESEALEAVYAALDDLERFEALGGDPAWSEFVDAFAEKLRRTSLESPESGAGVRVRDAMEARGDSFKALFLIGLKEGEFPRLIREDAILRDRTRIALRDTGGWWIHPKLSGYEEEKLLFHLLVGSASEKFVAVYPRSDDDGKAQIPSLYLRELAAGTETYVARQPFKKFRDEPWPLLNPKEVSLRLAADGADPDAYYEAMGLDGAGFRDCRAAAEALNAVGEPGPHDGVVGTPKGYEKRLLAGGLSPSALDTFGRCPFQFFASRVLGLSEPEEPEAQGDFSRLVKGDIYHRILKSFYDSLKDSDFAKESTAFPEAAFRAAFDGVLKEFGWRQTGLYPVLWRVSTRIMAEHLKRFLLADLADLRATGYRPGFLEEKVEGRLDVALPAGLEDLSFRGITDRVDLAPGRFRVIDYKLHWAKSRGKLASGVRRADLHQPAVYLELVGARQKGAKPDGVRFYALEDGEEVNGLDGVLEMSAEEWTELRPGALANIESFLASIHAGDFPIYVSDKCDWCSVAAACRKNHQATQRRARHGEKAAAYEAIKHPPKAVKAA